MLTIRQAQLVVILIWASLAGIADAQLAGETTTIDARTRWTFRTLSPVTLSSSIVRLGDVVQPIDPNQAGWQRLRQSAIGLVPLSGEAMTIQRDRLSRVILSAEATPRAIDWLGPTTIRIVYRPSAASDRDEMNPAEPIRQVAYRSESGQSDMAPAERLSSADAKRVIHWIELSLARFYPMIADSYGIDIDPHQPGLTPLRWLSGVTSLESIESIDDGPCRFLITARSATGPIESEITITLSAFPKIVVPRRTLGRGQRIEASDLEWKPFPPDQLDPSSVIDPEILVGQEVRSPLRAGRPILHSDVGSPILVHRGDLVEVRVIGGGVTVTTNAKALGDGAASDLIEIETMNPRKRLIASVATPGTVEIVTRAPNLPSSRGGR